MTVENANAGSLHRRSKFLMPPRVVVLTLIVVFGLLAGTVMFFAIGATADAVLLAKDGVEGQAIVADRHSRRVKTNVTTYEVTLAFITAKGQKVTVKKPVNAEAYQRLSIGATAPVRYAVAKPRVVELVPGDAWRSALMAWSLAAGLALGMGLSVWLGRVVKRHGLT